LQAASGRRDDIKVFGDDYATDDGTCVRDYIHINDLCEAHSLALQKMIEQDKSARYNLGNGKGFSVKQVIDVAKKVSGNDFKVIMEPRRAGDPATLVADATLANQQLNWQPKFAQLEDIVKTAWDWEVNFLAKQ
jgi:UDP-glucose 4-epimerase